MTCLGPSSLGPDTLTREGEGRMRGQTPYTHSVCRVRRARLSVWLSEPDASVCLLGKAHRELFAGLSRRCL